MLWDCKFGPVANDDIGFQMRLVDANLIDWKQFVKKYLRKL